MASNSNILVILWSRVPKIFENVLDLSIHKQIKKNQKFKNLEVTLKKRHTVVKYILKSKFLAENE